MNNNCLYQYNYHDSAQPNLKQEIAHTFAYNIDSIPWLLWQKETCSLKQNYLKKKRHYPM